MNRKYVDALEQVQLFEGLKQEEILKVLNCLNAYTREYLKGSYIYMHGECFTDIGIILEGKVTVDSTYQNGSGLTLNILEQYDTFGEDVVCLNHGQAPYSLMAQTKTLVLYLDGEKLLDSASTKCEYRSRVNLNMLKRLARYSFYMNQRMKYMSILNLKKRVITFLLDHKEKAASTTFSIGMNREEMASYLNATRSAISRVLIELKNEELIGYRKDLFTIKDEEAMIERID